MKGRIMLIIPCVHIGTTLDQNVTDLVGTVLRRTIKQSISIIVPDLDLLDVDAQEVFKSELIVVVDCLESVDYFLFVLLDDQSLHCF